MLILWLTTSLDNAELVLYLCHLEIEVMELTDMLGFSFRNRSYETYRHIRILQIM